MTGDAWRRAFKKPVFLLLIILTTLAWTLLQSSLIPGFFFGKRRVLRRQILDKSEGLLVNTQGCRIQNLDPEDPLEAKEWVRDRELSFECNRDGKRDPVRSTMDSLYVDTEALMEDYRLNSNKEIVCCYQDITTPKDSPTCVPFFGKTRIPLEFVRVSCRIYQGENFTELYRDYFAFPQPAEVYRPDHPRVPPPSDDRVNVLILGFDAVSRLNFHRQLPSVMDFLKARGVVELLGYNALGENTFPNLIPLLAGLTEEELVQTCWENSKKVFDDCYFIWNYYKSKGYITGFGEDSSDIGVFNYLKAGFSKQPTDFYTFYYNYIAEQDVGREMWLNCKLCFGRRPIFETVIDCALKFAVNLKENSNFGFFWINSISHDYLHLPYYANGSLISFLEECEKRNILNTTVFILMSDHGIRWGPLRRTYRGFIETRLPGMFLLFPSWFQNKYGRAFANLRVNQKRLTTPFDIHETLLDLAVLSRIRDSSIRDRSANVTWTRGRSLFLPVPSNRTCESAEIPPVWCTCFRGGYVSTTDPVVSRLGGSVVDFINNLLKKFPQCSSLTLLQIQEARLEMVLVPDGDEVDGSTIQKDYVLMVETEPGQGLFEATVRYFSADYRDFTVISPVSRINRYGNQSFCVTDTHIKPYCYCVQADINNKQ